MSKKKTKDKGKKKVNETFKKLKELNIQYLDRDDLEPNEYNPNRQTEKDFNLLIQSMKEDGFTQPVIAQEKPNPKTGKHTIVDGEHRWRASYNPEVDINPIPIVLVDMDEAQMKIATIRHNRARGEHDIGMEADILRDLEQLGGLELIQDTLLMEDVEIQRMLNDIKATEEFAAEEFSQAWEPEKNSSSDKELEDINKEVVNMRSPRAIHQIRKRDILIAEAKTEEEKQFAREQADIVRISYSFIGEEAKIVKDALGEHPAEKLVELCREHLNNT